MNAFSLRVLLLVLLASPASFAQSPGFPALNIRLLGRWHTTDSSETFSGLCGYAANGREYAIVGTTRGTAFVEVTDPTHPRLVQLIPGRQRAGLGGRSYQVYQHYAYGVADGQGGHSLQIFDLQYLPDSVRLRTDDPTLSAGASHCFIRNDRLYLAANWRDSASLLYHDAEAFTLQDPTRPVPRFRIRVPGLIPSSPQRVFADADSVYLALGINGCKRFVLNPPTSPGPPLTIFLGSASPCQAVAGSPSGRRILVANAGQDTASLSLYEFQYPSPNPFRRQPKFMCSFGLPSPASPRTVSFLGERYAIVAYQHEGVQVFDLLDPTHPRRIGFFDTHPANDSSISGYTSPAGAWTVDPNLPSRTLLATDRAGGLFILAPPYPWTPNPPLPPSPRQPGIWPNPTSGPLSITLPYAPETLTIEVIDALGRTVHTYDHSKLDLTGLAPGTYWLRLLRPDEPPRLERVVME